jgi:hypothetical protein
MLDPDPERKSMNPDPKQCLQAIKNYLNLYYLLCGSLLGEKRGEGGALIDPMFWDLERFDANPSLKPDPWGKLSGNRS